MVCGRQYPFSCSATAVHEMFSYRSPTAHLLSLMQIVELTTFGLLLLLLLLPLLLWCADIEPSYYPVTYDNATGEVTEARICPQGYYCEWV